MLLVLALNAIEFRLRLLGTTELEPPRGGTEAMRVRGWQTVHAGKIM
jgi:hypothetical protein